MKRFTKIMAILMITALIMSFAIISTSAATTVAGPAAVNFTKYMVVPNDTNIPNTTISFSIAPGTAVPANDTNVGVYAGPAGATVGTATFAPTDTTYTQVQEGDDVDFDTTREKYAKQTVAINLSGVTFTEPGIYRYAVTETSSTDNAVGKDTAPRYLDVYVTSDNNGNLSVSSTVLHTGTAAPGKNATGGSADPDGTESANALDDKTTGFTNHYPTQSLTFSKEVAGNQASRDKYFAFTLTISGVTAGNKYGVDLSDADASIDANPNAATTCIASAVTQPATLTVPTGQTSVTQVYYLKHGQSISVLGLPAGASYTILEAEEDYVPAVEVTGDVDASSQNEATITDNHQAAGTIDSDDSNITAAFTNNKDGVIPTGVLLTIAPFAIGILLFGALAIFLISKKRREAY